MMLYLIASLLIGLLLTCDVFILAHPYVPRRVYAILVLSISAFFLVQAYFTFYPLVVVTLGVHSVLLVKSTGKHYMFFYLPIGYILNCVFGNLVGLAFNLLWDLSVKELNADAAWIVLYSIGTGIVSFPALYLVRRLFLRYLGDILEGMGKKLLAFLALTLLLCAYMILTMASFFDTIEITHREYFLMVASLVLYFLFTFSMLFIVLHAARGNYEARKKVEYLEHLKEYTGNLEMVYGNLRSFRHDYINVMASLAAYIEEGRYEELRDFFYGHILPMQEGLAQRNDALCRLSHVHVLEVKSILYAKLLLAVNRGG